MNGPNFGKMDQIVRDNAGEVKDNVEKYWAEPQSLPKFFIIDAEDPLANPENLEKALDEALSTTRLRRSLNMYQKTAVYDREDGKKEVVVTVSGDRKDFVHLQEALEKLGFSKNEENENGNEYSK